MHMKLSIDRCYNLQGPSLTEGWQAEVESGYGEVHKPILPETRASI
jgi:hypothetical protein